MRTDGVIICHPADQLADLARRAEQIRKRRFCFACSRGMVVT